MNKRRCVIDIEIYEPPNDWDWHQARYLVHGTDDVMWTDNKEMAVEYILDELKRLERDETL